MLEKIKGVLELKEEIDSLRKEIESQKELVRSLSEEYRKQIGDIKKQESAQKDAAREMQEAMDRFRNEIRRELSEFRALNKGLQKQSLERFEKELADQFAVYGKNLEIDRTNYMKMRADVEEAGKQIAQLNVNVKKLIEVSAAIKKEDFELTAHHKMLLANDKNKQELLAKIDALERLMAAMQRNRRKEQQPPRKAPYA